MNILIIGSGGREHALAWKAAQSKRVNTVFVAPGNAGTELESGVENVAIEVMDFARLAEFAEDNNVALTIIGPEAPLVAGIVDYFTARGLPCLGPTEGAAQLEGSKAFTKDFLAKYAIPTADYQTFTELDKALVYVRKHYSQQHDKPIVIKADGLAAGKGVIIAETLTDAETAVTDMLSGNAFGEAGCKIVIEEFLQGEEASFIVLVDGEHCLPMATSQDHKRVGNGDTGPNTGGMGAYSPAPVVTEAVHQRIMTNIIMPTIKGMASEGHPYKGFLYAGLMITPEGVPKVIEYNCRFGDPETQPIMMRLQSDFVELCEHAVSGNLDQCTAIWDPAVAVGVVLAAGGYPGDYNKGDIITGLPEKGPSQEQILEDEILGEKVFHAGTALESGQLVTHGGRVLCATALGRRVSEAREKAYSLVRNIHWNQVYYRDDIAYRAINRERNQR